MLFLLVSAILSGTAGAGEAKLTVPKVTIEALPSVIHLQATTPAGERIYNIEARRKLEGSQDEFQFMMPLSGDSYKGNQWKVIHSAEPGKTFLYKFQASSGSASGSSDWT